MKRHLKNFRLGLKKLWQRLFKKPEKIGTVLLSGGQRLYELEVKTGKLKEFDLKDAAIDKRTGDRVLKVAFRKNCDYFKSYNRKAAEKKARQRYLKGKY